MYPIHVGFSTWNRNNEMWWNLLEKGGIWFDSKKLPVWGGRGKHVLCSCWQAILIHLSREGQSFQYLLKKDRIVEYCDRQTETERNYVCRYMSAWLCVASLLFTTANRNLQPDGSAVRVRGSEEDDRRVVFSFLCRGWRGSDKGGLWDCDAPAWKINHSDAKQRPVGPDSHPRPPDSNGPIDHRTDTYTLFTTPSMLEWQWQIWPPDWFISCYKQHHDSDSDWAI